MLVLVRYGQIQVLCVGRVQLPGHLLYFFATFPDGAANSAQCYVAKSMRTTSSFSGWTSQTQLHRRFRH